MFIKTKMTLNTKHTLLILSLCVGFAACSETDESWTSTGEGKTPITLSVGGVDAPASRAVITDGQKKTMQPFDVNTKIFMIMKSERDMTMHDGYEYKGDRTSPLYTVTRGDVKKKDDTNDGVTVEFVGNNQKYWDDAHARSSMLNIWAYAQMGQRWTECSFPMITNGSLNIDDVSQGKFKTDGEIGWQTTEIYPAILSWSVGNPGPKQTANDLIGQDLLFSNNIVNYDTDPSPNPAKDKRLKFDFDTKRFPRETDAWTDGSLKTQMKFYHAMSKITIQIKAGDGYKADGTDFVLENSKSVDFLDGFNTKGLFNIKDGEFQKINETAKITSIPLVSEKTGKTDFNYVLEALAVPNIHQFLNAHGATDNGSRFLENGDNVMIQFTIDHNTYRIKSGALYDALKDLTVGDLTNQIKKCTDNGNYIPLEAGKNYVFTFTIDKEKINNISAHLAEWIPVTAVEQTPSNAYVHVAVKTTEGSAVHGDPTFDLYRAPGALYTGEATETGYNNYADYTWEKNYEKSTSLSETGTNTGIYSTEWFWPNNKTFYHFRTINKGLSVTSSTSDVVSMYSGPINDTYSDTNISTEFADGKYNDYIWGAPFKSTAPSPTVYSSAYGFCNNASKEDGQLYKGIGSTKENIMLIQHHMMSNIYVDLETTTGTDKVDLTDATVKLVYYAKEAKLQMGNGLVTSYSNYDNGAGTLMTDDVHATDPVYDYSYRVVPQSLTNTSNGAGTKVGMVITTTDGNVYIIDDLSKIKESGKNEITEWLPGKKYYYKFTLKKTGITNLSATIVDWAKVNVENEIVTIK